MENIIGEKRRLCLPLFEEVPRWKAFIQSALEDGMGLLKADDGDRPHCAVIFYGGLVIYGGDPSHPAAGELVRQFKVQPGVLDWSAPWTALLKETHEGATPIRRYFLPFEGHNRKATAALGREGREKGVMPIDEEIYDSLEASLGWNFMDKHYRGKDDFIARGLGFALMGDGVPTSAAAAFCRSRSHAECQVTTAESFRRQGLAPLAAAAFIEECYRRGLAVPWDAVSEASVRLGRRLGYERVDSYEILEILPREEERP